MGTSTTPTGKRSSDFTNVVIDDELWVDGNLYLGGSTIPFTPPQDRNIAQITSAADFLNYGSVASNILTLPGGYVYTISGSIDLSDIGAERIVVSPLSASVVFAGEGQAVMVSSSANPSLSAADTAGNSLIIKDVNIYNLGGGKSVSYTSTAASGALFVEGSLLASASNCIDATLAGGLCLADAVSMIAQGTAPAITLDGTASEIAISNTVCRGGLVDFGTIVTKVATVTGCNITTTTGQTAFTGAATSANIDANGFGVISGNALNNDGGTALSGIADSDARWVIQVNGGF